MGLEEKPIEARLKINYDSDTIMDLGKKADVPNIKKWLNNKKERFQPNVIERAIKFEENAADIALETADSEEQIKHLTSMSNLCQFVGKQVAKGNYGSFKTFLENSRLFALQEILNDPNGMNYLQETKFNMEAIDFAVTQKVLHSFFNVLLG